MDQPLGTGTEQDRFKAHNRTAFSMNQPLGNGTEHNRSSEESDLTHDQPPGTERDKVLVWHSNQWPY